MRDMRVDRVDERYERAYAKYFLFIIFFFFLSFFYSRVWHYVPMSLSGSAGQKEPQHRTSATDSISSPSVTRLEKDAHKTLQRFKKGRNNFVKKFFLCIYFSSL